MLVWSARLFYFPGPASLDALAVQEGMSEYAVAVSWHREGAVFSDGRYSRGHIWQFDGGQVVEASASPHIVPLPMSIESAVDPEEAFIASLSSCHMLFFLSIACKRGFVVEDYVDDAVGVLEKNEDGVIAMTRVTLRPAIRFGGDKQPSSQEFNDMHHESHEECFIAQSVKTEVRCEPSIAV